MPRNFIPNKEIIQEKIDGAKEILKDNKYPIGNISAIELIAYFEGDAPSGDVTTLQDILKSKWLLIHELVEINELKKKGLEISSKLLLTHAELVFETHLVAAEWELKLAKKADDSVWIMKRINDIKNWLEDPTLVNHFRKSCNDLLQKFK